MKKEYFKHPLAITLYVIAGIGLLLWGINYIFQTGRKNGLEEQLAEVNKRLQNTSARNSEFAKLVGKRLALQELLAKL